MVDVNLIGAYLKQYGWQYETAENDAIVAGFGVDMAQFLVVFQLSPPWLRIHIPVYLLGSEKQVSDQLALALLKDNYNTRLARFAIDEHDRVILCLDMYIANGLEYSQFEINLDAITFFAETLYKKLM